MFSISSRPRFVPLLIRPKLLSFKNYWREASKSREQQIRDMVILLFAAGVMYALFRGGLWMLNTAEADRRFVYLHPSLPLGLVFLFLLVVLTFSNAASALATLYLSGDLDLVLSSPFPRWRFFFNKLLDIMVESSWISIVFLLPALLSFVSFYHPSPIYYLLIVAVMIPFFVIPTSLSIILVTLYARLVPANRTRETVLFVISVGLVLLYLLFTLVLSNGKHYSLRNINDVLQLVAILSIPNQPWVPSYWASTCLAEMLVPSKQSILPHLALLYSVAIGLVALAFILLRLFHFDAYSKAGSSRRQVMVDSRRSQARFAFALGWLSPPMRAVLTKEYKLFTRDITQIFQLLLLGGICVVYFYNFRMLNALHEQLPPDSKAWWKGMLFMVNNSLEAFLITAVGTRFVFQSLSLEGRSIWVLQTSPMTFQSLVRAKFLAWLLPVAVVLSLVFGFGTFAISGTATSVFLKVLTSWILCYGIVGLAVGLGAHFANFSWEHSSQLVASFGSLVYMFASIALISVDGALLALIYFFNYHRHCITLPAQSIQLLIGMALTGTLLLYVNMATTRWALALGERTLERRRE